MKNQLLQFFKFDHLPLHLRSISAEFAKVAEEMDKVLPNNAEKTTALRRLLEAKDCAVRAVLFKVETDVPGETL